MDTFLMYLIIINTLTFIYFGIDKFRAVRGRRRVSESFLHILEILGGVFIVIIAFHIFRHKRGKMSYYLFTYIILALWILALLGYFQVSYKFLS